MDSAVKGGSIMNTVLIFPPSGDVTQPPLGLSLIAGFVRRHHKNVKLYDLNIDCMDYFLNPDYLEHCYEKIKKRLAILNDKTVLSASELDEYKSSYQSYLDAKYLIKNMKSAFSAVKSSDTYQDWDVYSMNTSIIERGMELVSNCFYPTKWNFRSLTFAGSSYDSNNVINKLGDVEENFLIPYFRDKSDELLKQSPAVIGIAINYASQLIPGLTLARILKEKKNTTRIVLGGSFFSNYMDRWHVFNVFSSYIDVIIPFSGEMPLYRIICNLEQNKGIDTISDCVINVNGQFRFTAAGGNDEAARTLPDFSDFDLSKYLTPCTVLPYLLSTGCYWGKCRFCNYKSYHVKDNIQKRDNSVSGIVNDLKELSEKYGARYFYFVDEAVPPVLAKSLSDKLIAGRLGFHWFGEMRFDRFLSNDFLSLVKKGGCDLILFGLESGNDRVLKAMNKGTTVKAISDILSGCSTNDIRTFVMFFIGFPSETREEALSTINLIERHRNDIQYIGFDNFTLYKTIELHRNPEQYHLELKENPDDLAILDHYSLKSGLSEYEAKCLVYEFEERPVIHNYIKRFLISRNHLVFLPRTIQQKDNLEQNPFSLHFGRSPILNNDVVFAESTVDLLGDFSKGRYCYFYNPVTQDICGLHYSEFISKYCFNQDYHIEDILNSAGANNSRQVVSFYESLFNKGMLKWK